MSGKAPSAQGGAKRESNEVQFQETTLCPYGTRTDIGTNSVGGIGKLWEKGSKKEEGNPISSDRPFYNVET